MKHASRKLVTAADTSALAVRPTVPTGAANTVMLRVARPR
jgi:hypothetical protein